MLLLGSDLDVPNEVKRKASVGKYSSIVWASYNVMKRKTLTKKHTHMREELSALIQSKSVWDSTVPL